MAQDMQSFVQRNDYSGAIKSFSALELQAEEDSLASDSIAALGEYFYASYLACYLIVGDLSSAKYLWKRAPANLKVQESGSMLCEVWTVGKAIWQNDYISAITSLSTEWPDYLKPLTFTLREKLLLSQLDTIARAYDVLSVELLSTKLGINQEETIQRAQACGWVIEGDSARSSRIAQSDNLGDNLSENLALLQKVTGFAAHFDRSAISVDK
eukprot:CAMPEP_0184968804 /NCGR_PEP_ID=MMETSP1098-20130426/1748_1 /TAXON_ID=89044 /ORGANISM="Spumella elongata, Strain CCAP 955/1" /LENGTH=211 /DNA_ID=CAMNT_0027490469 /DNA_START=14 /DNA_END=649 /DNA_ORIENTATION=+